MTHLANSYIAAAIQSHFYRELQHMWTTGRCSLAALSVTHNGPALAIFADCTKKRKTLLSSAHTNMHEFLYFCFLLSLRKGLRKRKEKKLRSIEDIIQKKFEWFLHSFTMRWSTHRGFSSIFWRQLCGPMDILATQR